MHTKYIFVSGGVISGIGKGTTAASIALLLKSTGYQIAPLKFENYLNLVNGILKGPKSGKTSSFYMQLVLDDIARLLEVDPRKDIIPPEPIRRRTIINHAR